MSKKQNETRESRDTRAAGFKKVRDSLKLDTLTSNDIKYYNKNTINYDKATAVPWVSTLGDRLQVTGITSGGTGFTSDFTYPGIISYKVVVGPGYAKDATDPLNVALTRIMSELYGKTSASTIPFAQADLGMLLTSTSCISDLFAHAKKLVDASHLWVDRNVYYPRAIFKACGIDFNDFIANQSNYIVRLNELIRRFNSMYCLKFVDVYDRQYALFRNVYVDEDSPMGQMYFFVPQNYYIYDDVNLKATYTALTCTTFKDLLDHIEAAIAAWLSSQDLYYINGYLNRAFTNNERLVIDETSGTEAVNPVVDEVMEMQINNATILPLKVASLDITQTPVTGEIKWQPVASYANYLQVWKEAVPLKAYKADPSKDDNMEMTRFTVLCGDVYNSGSEADLYYCGPEIITQATVVSYDRFTDSIGTWYVSTNIYYIDDDGSGHFFITDADPSDGTKVVNLLNLAQFRVIPYIWIISKSYGVQGVGTPMFTLGDIYNYTLYTKKQYYDMQRTALFSLYNIVNL